MGESVVLSEASLLVLALEMVDRSFHLHRQRVNNSVAKLLRGDAGELFKARRDAEAKVMRDAADQIEKFAEDAQRDWEGHHRRFYTAALEELQRRDPQAGTATPADQQWSAIQKGVSDLYCAYYGDGEGQGAHGTETARLLADLLKTWDAYLD